MHSHGLSFLIYNKRKSTEKRTDFADARHHAGRGREKRQHGGNRSAARPLNDYSIAVNHYLSQQFLQTLGLNLIKIPAFGPKVCIFFC